MNRKSFIKNAGLATAGLALADKNLLAAAPLKNSLAPLEGI